MLSELRDLTLERGGTAVEQLAPAAVEPAERPGLPREHLEVGGAGRALGLFGAARGERCKRRCSHDCGPEGRCAASQRARLAVRDSSSEQGWRPPGKVPKGRLSERQSGLLTATVL